MRISMVVLTLGLISSLYAKDSNCPKQDKEIESLKAQIEKLESSLPNYLCEAICLMDGYTVSEYDQALIMLSDHPANFTTVSAKASDNKMAFDNLKTECPNGKLLSKNAYQEMATPRGMDRGILITRLPTIQTDCQKSN